MMKAKHTVLKRLLLTLFLAVLLCGCQNNESGPSEQTDPSATTAETAFPSVPEPNPEPEPEPEPEPSLPSYDYTKDAPAHEAVDDSYFEDAVFIGDSRTEGMFLYGSLEEATYLCGKGANVANVSTKQNITVDETDMTIMEALAQTACAKIYLSLGLNELGWNDPSIYKTSFGDLIDTIRALHPDAIIYLQDIAPVNTETCAKLGHADYINNDRIAQYNALLYELAEEKQVILLKVSDALKDENGELPADVTSDGIHFNASFYKQWCDYLRTHTVDPEDYDPPAGQAPAAPADEGVGNSAVPQTDSSAVLPDGNS